MVNSTNGTVQKILVGIVLLAFGAGGAAVIQSRLNAQEISKVKGLPVKVQELSTKIEALKEATTKAENDSKDRDKIVGDKLDKVLDKLAER